MAEMMRKVFLRVEIFEEMRFLFVFSDDNGSQCGGNSQITWNFWRNVLIIPLWKMRSRRLLGFPCALTWHRIHETREKFFDFWFLFLIFGDTTFILNGKSRSWSWRISWGDCLNMHVVFWSGNVTENRNWPTAWVTIE